MQVDLPEPLEAVIRAKVASGEYPDATAVVAEAIALLANRDGKKKSERLRDALQVGIDQIDQGEVVERTPALSEEILENARHKAREGKRPKADVLQ